VKNHARVESFMMMMMMMMMMMVSWPISLAIVRLNVAAMEHQQQ
jgi:hypothetical protein